MRARSPNPATVLRFLGLTMLTGAAATALAPGADAQSAQIEVDDPVFEFLSTLVGHRCEIRAVWPDGTAFRLDKEFAWGLDGRIVTVDSFIVDGDGTRRPRNHGVRAYRQDTGSARFWEFDRLGSVTEGPVWVEDGNLHYEYPYGSAGLLLRDTWTPEEDGSYRFRVREWTDGNWGRTLMDGVYRCSHA